MPPSPPPIAPPPSPPPSPPPPFPGCTSEGQEPCTYPTTAAGQHALQRFNRECIALHGEICVPCSSFNSNGSDYRVSLSDPSACVDCSGGANVGGIIGALVAAGLSWTSLFVAFVVVATRYPHLKP